MTTSFLVVKNRAYSKLAAAITAGATTLTVTSGEGANFPSTYPFHLTIDDEVVSCTARSTDSLTIVRAQQGTSGATHANKAYVALNITAKSITDLNTAVNDIEKYADYGLSFFGAVTEVVDSTHFKVASLAGLGASTFLPASGTPYEIFVFKADGAAPQGEQKPVVAYTTGDGTFQHAAFTQLLAVGDEVLIIHPLLASLGTKAASAASGAVTSTDYMMAYLKQIINELNGGSWTNLSNASISNLDGAIQALAKVLSIDAANEFSGSLDGSARTTLEAMWVALGVLLGTRSDSIPAMTATPGTLASLPLLKAILERIGVTPADPDDSLHTVIGQRDGTIPAMNAAISNSSTLAMNIRAIMERLGATPADSDDAVHTILGQRDVAATADDLSDITTTNALAKLRRLLLRFSSNAFAATVGGSSRTTLEAMIQALADYVASSGGAYSVSLDGSARTNLNAFHTALGVLLGTRDATVSAGVLADTESMTALLRRIATAAPLVLFGDITGYTDTENFVVADFIGWENDFFKGWSGYLVRDDGGATALPQGSRVAIKDYVSSTGALVTSALSAAGAVGDQFMLIHPILVDAWNLRGGVGGVADILESQAAELDTARGTSGAVSVDGGEDDVYNESSDNEFVLLELRVDLNNMGEGDTITFKVYTTEGGTERKISEDNANTFTDTQDPARVEIIGSANQVWGREGIRVTAVKIGGTTRNVTAYYRDSKRGS